MTTVIPLHFDLTLFAIVCYVVTFFACTAGLFYAEYKENWLQHFGMVITAIGAALKVFQLFERHRTSPETALTAFGVALFAVGVAVKVWQHRKGWDGSERRHVERRHAR